MLMTEPKPFLNARYNVWLAIALAALVVASVAIIPSSFALSPDSENLVKSTAIGAVGGAVLGGASDRQSLGKGALYGAAAGLGTGLVNNSDTLRNRDGIRRTATGAIVGAGAGATTGRSTTKGAILGAGAGLGWHVLKDGLR